MANRMDNKTSQIPADAKSEKAWLGKLFKFLIISLSKFSLKNQQRIGAGLGRFLSWFPNYNRDVVRANIRQVYPELSEAEQQKLALKSLQENVKSFAELGAVWGWEMPRVLPLIRQVHGEALIAQAFEKNKGVVMLSPHFGCWEMTSLYLTQNYDLTFLYQPPEVKSIEDFVSEVRARSGGTPAPTDMRGVKMMFKALRDNKMVGILPDQDPGDSGGIHAPFFNTPARTMTLVSKLAAKAQCDVLFIVGERLPNGEGFDIHVFPAEEDVRSKEENIATAALNRGVEKCVAIQPTQYLWSYKRFRHPPAGVRDIYKKDPG